ncbi:MAG TPA: aldehyde dehydrogenase family protein [Actinomycetota bacterium]
MSVRDVDRFFIGGAWVGPRSDEVVDVLNPATEEVIGRAAAPSTADAAEAVAAARLAVDRGPWPSAAPKERAAVLRRMGEILRARKREIGQLLIDEVGATVTLAKTGQGTWAIDAFDLCADWAEEFPWEEPLPLRPDPIPVQGVAVREPVGVVSAMTPFNYPFFVNCWKVAPALATGNAVVLKPSPWTPLDAFELARAAEEAGVPPGVLNVIGGGTVLVGQELCTNPGIDMVAFTGSVTGGRAVGAAAMQTVKKVQLELGGKSALVMLDDVEPDDVAWRLMFTCMMHAGQGCGCTTRLLVPRALHDATVEALVARCEAEVLGDPNDPATTIGPLIREEHRARVDGYVRLGVEEGATIATGGRPPPHLDRGFFYEPTVLTGVRNDMRVAQEEIFGPVLCVIPYRDEAEAIAIANDSMFGLGGAVVSNDRERAMGLARALRTGFVAIGAAIPPNYAGSWGGYKQSGVGREWRLGLQEFTELKEIVWSDGV